MVIQQVLQQLPQNQVALAPVSILFPTTAPPVVEPLREESIQSNSSDVNNLSTSRHPTSIGEEPKIFITRAEIEALVQREKEGASSIAACLHLKPPYPASIAAKQYLAEYTVLNFQSLTQR